MSATPPPTDPKADAKKAVQNAIIWTVLSVAFAIGLIIYSGKVDPEKKTFYLIAGGVAGIVGAVNAYSAWTQSQKTKEPPKA